MSSIKKVVEWYSNNYPYHNNPMALHTSLEKRPDTPVKTTRKVMLAGKQVEQEVDSLVAKNREQVAAMKAWGEALNKTPKWWPCADLHGHDGDSDDEDVVVLRRELYETRRAAKVLLQETAREKERLYYNTLLLIYEYKYYVHILEMYLYKFNDALYFF